MREFHHKRQSSIYMWCENSRISIFGSILYVNTLNGDRHVRLILNETVTELMDELRVADLPHVRLQSDGATTHYTSSVRRWLNADFPDR